MSLQQYESKLSLLLKSRKFWSAISALAVVGAGYASGQVTGGQAIEAVVGVMAAYCIGTGIEDNGKSSGGSSLPPTS